MRGLNQRIITAVFFVVVMMGGLFAGRYPFVLLFALITALCLWEFLGLTLESGNQRRDKGRKVLGVILGLSPFILISIYHLGWIQNPTSFITASLLLIFPSIFLIFIYELYTKSENPFTNIAFILLGLFYIGVPFSLVDIIAFRADDFQAKLIFGILLLTWSNDTGAYLVGSLIGKTPLLPRISPNKTWEGSIGGLVVTLGISLLLYRFIGLISFTNWIVLALIVSVFGSFGDLIESMLKRSLGKKDSGNLLPGHGGILDRFDAFIFLIPFAAAYLLWLR